MLPGSLQKVEPLQQLVLQLRFVGCMECNVLCSLSLLFEESSKKTVHQTALQFQAKPSVLDVQIYIVQRPHKDSRGVIHDEKVPVVLDMKLSCNPM